MAKALMIQGTMSNVGKSLLTAALLRIFREDGFSCAPFKAQNMALNSYVTPDGCEIGRAQAMQAEAACCELSADLNPILLKPTSDLGSQVIVNGHAIGTMRASEYFRRKTELWPDIERAYKRLSEKNDILVIEGAGSPAELNLKADDIVNMGLAERLDVPVLLAGDIDRGGIFAQLYGTVMLLTERESARVGGLIVNKFRGDRALFNDGVRILEELCQKRVAGVVPYLPVTLDAEDSLSDTLLKRKADAPLDLAVVRFPRISNFTDFDAFSQYQAVSLRYVTSVAELGTPDLLFLPGSKNTIGDLQFLYESHLAEKIKELARGGMPVFGICGGYQMLGEEIADPAQCEGGGSIQGLGLLPVKTVLQEEKTLRQCDGSLMIADGFFKALSGARYEGYEIHHGMTGSKAEGASLFYAVQNVGGCYVHGLFDRGEISECLVRALCEKKNIPFAEKGRDQKERKEEQYRLLAEGVRKSLDMEFVYGLLR